MGKVFREFFPIPIEDRAELANFILGSSTSPQFGPNAWSPPLPVGEAEGLTNDH